MGVKTDITIKELNRLFSNYNFTSITPTSSGIIDTTYIIYTKTNSYILKRYERATNREIKESNELLKRLKDANLNVSTCRDVEDDWYIYERLAGESPSCVKSYHIQAIARFLALLHKESSTMRCNHKHTPKKEIITALKYTKENYFSYYKKFESLQDFREKNDGIIHGDIFKDNTIFDKNRVGVIDFIDSFCGAFEFDVAVTLIGFNIKSDNNYYINLFLLNYNQHRVKKLTKKVVIEQMKYATNFYALKRVYEYKNTKKAKELL